MEREQAIAEIKSRLKCANYLEKSKSGLYCCPYCGSGTGTHGTGAIKVYETNTFTCHSCKQSGDVLDLIQEKYSTDFNGAVMLAAGELNITIEPYRQSAATDFAPQRRKNALTSHGTRKEDKTPAYKEKAHTGANNSPTEGIADYTGYYRECAKRLPESKAALSYLAARGISPATAATYNIGFDPEADPANNPGAAVGEDKPHPAARLIIPTATNHYIGRSIDLAQKDFAKLNPNRSKGAGEPGILNAAALYSNAQTVFVTEGAFDALSIAETGRAAIATNSTANTAKLLDLLKDRETVARLIICFDNDPDAKTAERTRAAAQRLKQGLQAQGVFSIVFDISAYTRDGEKDINDILRRSKGDLEAMLAAAEAAAAHEANRDDLSDFLEKIQTAAYKPYQTGLSFFDNLLGGGVIQQSILLLMAAPGTGKTALAQQIAEEMAARRKPVIYLNLEMSREQMLARAISGRLERKGKGQTALKVLQSYNWTEQERADITAAIEEYREKIYPFIRYNPDEISSDLDEILQYLRREGERARAAGQDAPAVIVDYLHLISSRSGLDVQELIKQAVTGLKDYAKTYNTFVIGIVATNRASNTAGKITMESGRDSSNLEYTGDYQLSLNYYAIDNGTVKTNEVDKIAELQTMKWRKMIIRVLKSRFSVPGKSERVYFNAAHNTFYGEFDFIPVDDERTPFDEPAKEGKTEGETVLKRR